ncbi:MAG: hypothetical protein ABSG93_19385 [Solirubrobacteraceae bacterium]|jgi:hypothetical protein
MLALTTTAGIALYAAFVATGGLAVQLIREWRTWGTRLTVKVRPMRLARPSTALTAEAEPVVVFELINHSDHPVKVSSLWLEPLKHGGASALFPSPFPRGTPGPHEIPPHDSITLYQPRDSLGEGEPDHRTRAGVATSDGKTFKSQRIRVGDLLED